MKILLIPSATLIPFEMRSKMGTIPTCLFPLENMTMLERINNIYHGYVDRIYVVAGCEKEKVQDFISIRKLDIQIIEMQNIKDLGYTVWTGLNQILQQENAVEQLYINFGDTLISNIPNHDSRDSIYYVREKISQNWTFFSHKDGVILDIIDKHRKSKRKAEFGNLFTGVFEISNPRSLLDELSTAVECPAPQIDSFYQAIMHYSSKYPFECILTEDWFDVGHSDRYAQAKTIVAARVFNTIEIDKDRGILTKRSENKEKLIDEIKWYIKIPGHLQYLLPRIYHYSLDWNDPYVSMEYYGYNTLHEMLVFGDISDSQWRKIFQRLHFILNDLWRYRIEDDVSTRRMALEKMYIEKTISRIEELRKDDVFLPFFSDKIRINGKEYPSLDECIGFLPELLRKRLIADTPAFCIIHGDLCFSNILAENDFGFLRVIDPRGSFGDYDIYGDQRYEIAKLMHSLDGQYDFITEDMVDVRVEGSCIELKKPQKSKEVYLIFRDEFQSLLHDYDDLKLIESLLFLSMIPLHSDHLNRQYAMLATGLQLLNEAGTEE